MIDPAFTPEKKVAVVVGAASGIGTGGARALPVPLDVTNGASCRAAVAATVQDGGYTAV